MDFDKKDKEMDWNEAEAKVKKAFDFDAFLGTEALDDRVTDVMDGKDLLEPDAFDYFAPDYIPRRPSEVEGGRHAAPEDESAEEEKPVMDPNDPRYAAPERPRVLVAERRPTVYVTPEGDFSREETPPGGGNGGESRSWMIAVLITLGVLAAVLAVVLGVLRGLDGSREPSAPVSTPVMMTARPEATPEQEPEPTEAPEETPKPTEPPKSTYMITVTAGTGGSVSPSGAVVVEEGSDASFAITPDPGYELTQLLVDGKNADLTNFYTFASVKKDHTLYAVFQPMTTPTPAPSRTKFAPP